MSLGLRKKGKLNHLIKLLNTKGIKYDLEEISDLSTSQMRKKIKELGGVTAQQENLYESRGKMIDEIQSFSGEKDETTRKHRIDKQ